MSCQPPFHEHERGGKRGHDHTLTTIANATEDEGYFIANARASLDFGPSNEYRLTIWGKNIFNEEFFSNRFDDVSGLGPDTVLLNDPATYGVTLRGEF